MVRADLRMTSLGTPGSGGWSGALQHCSSPRGSTDTTTVGLVLFCSVAIGHTFNYDRDYHIPAEEVERVEAERTRMLASHV